MLSNLSHLEKKILDVKYGRVKQGLKIGVPEIDEHIRFKSNNFNLILGHANVGKTTVILYLMLLYTIKHNIKWLIFSAENSSQSIARKILEFKTGKPVNNITDKDIQKTLDWFNTYFKIIEVDDLYNYKDLLSEAKQIKEKFNYDGFLIDPYNSLVKDRNTMRGINGHEYDYQVATEFRLFCKHQNVSIWLNAHAVTEALRKVHNKEHKYSGLPIPPSLADVEGGGKWGNRADDVFTIHRYIQHSTDWMISEIHVRKIKEVETGGRPTPIEQPIKLRMTKNNIGFEFAGVNILHCNNVDIKDILNIF
jgi:hypothetical protein